MKATALILGILGALAGLALATSGSMMLGLLGVADLSQSQQDLARLVAWGLVGLAFVGVRFVFSKPRVAAASLLAAAAGWLLLEGVYGEGFSFASASAMVLCALSGVLVMLARQPSGPAADGWPHAEGGAG